MEEINKKEREKLWEQSHVRPALENLVPRSVVKKIQSEEEADIKVIDPERQLKGIEHKLEQEKVQSGEKWNVDKLFPLTKPKNISQENMFNERLEVQRKASKIYGPAAGYIRRVLKNAERKQRRKDDEQDPDSKGKVEMTSEKPGTASTSVWRKPSRNATPPTDSAVSSDCSSLDEEEAKKVVEENEQNVLMMKRKQSIRLTTLMKPTEEDAATLTSLGVTRQDIDNKLKRSKSNNAFLVRAAKHSSETQSNIHQMKQQLLLRKSIGNPAKESQRSATSFAPMSRTEKSSLSRTEMPRKTKARGAVATEPTKESPRKTGVSFKSPVNVNLEVSRRTD